MRTPATMYYGQRDGRGRAAVYADPCDGTGPRRLRFLNNMQTVMPDWGKGADGGRTRLLAHTLLAHALEDDEWASQLSWQFAAAIIEKLHSAKWQINAAAIFAAVTALETGQEIVLRNK